MVIVPDHVENAVEDDPMHLHRERLVEAEGVDPHLRLTYPELCGYNVALGVWEGDDVCWVAVPEKLAIDFLAGG